MSDESTNEPKNESTNDSTNGSANDSTKKTEEFSVKGEDLLARIKQIIREGNIRRIIIKNDQDKTLVELPLTLGVVGAVLAPTLAAVGAIAALVTNCKIVVERK